MTKSASFGISAYSCVSFVHAQLVKVPSDSSDEELVEV